MSEKIEPKKERKMRTAWREECRCPRCHAELLTSELNDQDGEANCPSCSAELYIQSKVETKTLYRVLS